MSSKGTLTVRILGDSKGFEKSLGDMDKSLGTWAKGVGAALGGAGLLAGGAFAGAFVGAMNREKLNDKLAAQLSLSEKDAKRIAEIGSKVYAGAWGDSVEEVNEAIRSIGLELGDLSKTSDDELFDMTTQALDMASAFDVDVTEAIRSASILMRNGLAVDAEQAFDIITAGFQSGADRSGDLLDSINEYSEPLGSLGIEGGKALGIINSALDDGIWNTDRLLDGIKEFSIRVIEDSPPVAEAFDAMNLKADDLQAAIAAGGPTAKTAMDTIVTALAGLEDPMERERAGVALFGTVWEDVGGDVILNALDPLKSKIVDVEGATVAMGETLNGNVATNIESFKRRAGEAITSWVTENVLPAASDVLAAFDEDGVGGAFDKVGELWAEAWPEIEVWLEETVGPALVDWAKNIGISMGKALGAFFVEEVKREMRTVLSIPGVGGTLLNEVLPPALKGIGGNASSGSGPVTLPQAQNRPIPRLHSGGVFNSGRGEGLALLRDGERVLTPEQDRAQGAIHITVNAKVVKTDREFQDLVASALVESRRSNPSLAGAI